MIVFKNKKAYLKKRKEEVEITSRLFQNLYEPVSFHKDFTVKDLFTIVSKSPEILKILSRYDGSAFIKETLTRRSRNHVSKSSKIEFYWFTDPFNNSLDGLDFPKVHGVDGRGRTFGLDFLPGSEIKHCRIKINSDLNLDVSLENNTYRVNVGKMIPTVGQVIFGLIWELSYWGSATKRDATRPTQEEEEYLDNPNPNPRPASEIFDEILGIRNQRRRRP